MQSQLVCIGCRNVLSYLCGAPSVRCAVCGILNPVQEMSHLVCGGCMTLLMFASGATSVRCSCCNTMNSATTANLVAQVNCGHCYTTLMYPSGASSVKCAVCGYFTDVGISSMMMPAPVYRPNGTALASTSTPVQRIPSQTVVVENPMTVDESGKLVSNVVVGVANDRN